MHFRKPIFTFRFIYNLIFSHPSSFLIYSILVACPSAACLVRWLVGLAHRVGVLSAVSDAMLLYFAVFCYRSSAMGMWNGMNCLL